MENNTIIEFNCKICGKHTIIQTVYSIRDENKICGDCFLKEYKKEE